MCLTSNEEPGCGASERRTALFWDGSLQRSVDSPLLSVQRLFSREAELASPKAILARRSLVGQRQKTWSFRFPPGVYAPASFPRMILRASLPAQQHHFRRCFLAHHFPTESALHRPMLFGACSSLSEVDHQRATTISLVLSR